MSLTTEQTQKSEQITITRTRLNSLITEFTDFTFDEYGNLTLDLNLIVAGDLITTGADLLLNSGEAGAGVAGGTGTSGVVIERGTEINATITWNEPTTSWQAGIIGTLFDLITTNDLTAYYTQSAADALFINKTGSLSMTGNFKLGANWIGFDGAVDEGLSFDTNGNATFSNNIQAGGNLTLRNSTTATEFIFYNTYTDVSNYERGFIKWNSDVLEIGFEVLGTGVKRELGFSMTGLLKLQTYSAELADDAIITINAITTSAFGWIIVGDNEEFTQFRITSDGTVTLLNETGNIVANADTDAKFCVGTAATQEPLQIRNRLAATKNVNMVIWYD